jgi:hypothetical protein
VPNLRRVYFFLRRGSSLAMHRSHGLARWASHSFCAGKILTTIQRASGAAGSTRRMVLALRCGGGGRIRYQTTNASAVAWRGLMSAV